MEKGIGKNKAIERVLKISRKKKTGKKRNPMEKVKNVMFVCNALERENQV